MSCRSLRRLPGNKAAVAMPGSEPRSFRLSLTQKMSFRSTTSEEIMNIKGFLVTVAIAAVVMASINSASMAEPGMQAEPGRRATADSPDERIKYRLGKLSQRLEIRASQQAAWDRFANSVEMLAERRIQQPGTDADAAAIARYHADRASDFAKKLGVIADATDNLQKVLTEDQRKVFNQAARLAMHGRHEWSRQDHGMESGNHDAGR